VTDLAPFLARHVERFNAGVVTGDFGPLVGLFAEDAILDFAGIPVGPFEGREAIAEAYATQPPTDTMTSSRRGSSRTARSSRRSRGRPTEAPPRARCASRWTAAGSGGSSSPSADGGA